jgi:hypothetical protein
VTTDKGVDSLNGLTSFTSHGWKGGTFHAVFRRDREFSAARPALLFAGAGSVEGLVRWIGRDLPR